MTNLIYREAILQVYELASSTERLEIVAPLMCIKKVLLRISVLPDKAIEEFMTLYTALREKSQEGGWNPELPSLLRRMLFMICLSDNPIQHTVKPEALLQVCKCKADCLRLTRKYNTLLGPVWAHYSMEVSTAERSACNALYAMLEEQFSLWLQVFNCTNKGEAVQQQEAYIEGLKTVHTRFIYPREYATLLDEITVKQTLMMKRLNNLCLSTDNA